MFILFAVRPSFLAQPTLFRRFNSEYVKSGKKKLRYDHSTWFLSYAYSKTDLINFASSPQKLAAIFLPYIYECTIYK